MLNIFWKMPNVPVIDASCNTDAPGTDVVDVPPPGKGVVTVTGWPGTSCAPCPVAARNEPPRELAKALTPRSLPALRSTSAKRTSTITCWLDPTEIRLITLSPA